MRETDRQRATRVAREHARAEVQHKLANARWYLAHSDGCTELTCQRWRELIAEYELDLSVNLA